MNTIQKRYCLTGSGIVLVLVGLVFGGRYFTKGTFFPLEEHNLKQKGPKNAPVVLTVYSDFQCPACQKAYLPIEELRKQFPDDIRVEFRHYPLERAHRWAIPAAIFAECAAEQGKFWEYHDRLYSEQSKWAILEDAIPMLVKYAQEAGLSREPFEACVGNPKTLERIRAERLSGERRQVQSTPTMFINETRLVGYLELTDRGKNIVSSELEKVGRKAVVADVPKAVVAENAPPVVTDDTRKAAAP